jgi:hypothetical protein
MKEERTLSGLVAVEMENYRWCGEVLEDMVVDGFDGMAGVGGGMAGTVTK